MDAVTPKFRNSRWDREPVLDTDGKPVVTRITNRDIEIFRLLARYRYLPLNDIHAFIGGSLKNVTHRLGLLSRKPNLYINRPHQQRQSADTNHRHIIYELDDRGIAILRDLGVGHLAKVYHRNFTHELMVCRIMASFELGTRENVNIRLITWQEIMASDKIPLATKNLSNPASVSVSLMLRGERCTKAVVADAQPFGLERSNEDGTRAYFFFPGIEADCGTEPIESYDYERSSIHNKFTAYRAIAEQDLYRSHFGFPNCFVPFITTTTARMQSMMHMLEKLTDGRGSKMFLFKTFPTLTSFEKQVPPSGHMLTTPWQRAGFAPFDFTK